MPRLVPILVLLALVLVMGGLVFFQDRGSGRVAVPSGVGAGVAERRDGALSPVGGGALPGRDVPEVGGEEGAAGVGAEVPDAAVVVVPEVVRGRVLALSGAPVKGVAVVVRGRSERATTDVEGRFEVEVALEGMAELLVEDPDWVTVRVSEARGTSRGREHPIVVAPAVRVGGFVVYGGYDDPVLNARVRYDVPRELCDPLPIALDTTRARELATAADDEGRFAFDAAPAAEGAWLEASAPGFRPARVAAPLSDVASLLLRLERIAPDGDAGALARVLTGSVVWGTGVPAPDALVRLDTASTRTDGRGEFRLELERTDPRAALVAVKEGEGFAVVPDFGRVAADLSRPLEPIVLVLEPAQASLRGRVLGADGRPCVGWKARLLGGHSLLPSQVQPLLAEGLVSESANEQRTDEEGAFAFDGLSPTTEYRVRAWREETLEIVESPPVLPGPRALVLRVPAGFVRERIGGQVVGRDGTPLPNVRVRLTMDMYWNDFGGRSMHSNQETLTDVDGRFELRNVPRSPLFLRFTGEDVEDVAGGRYDLAPEDEAADLRIEIPRRCHFRFESTLGDAGPRSISAEDAQGRVVLLATIESGRSSRRGSVELDGGRSATLAVSEDARWLVLRFANGETERVPLALEPGQVTTVRR